MELDEEELGRLDKEGGLLSVATETGVVLYPAFQFQSGATIPALRECLSALTDARLSSYTIASWFRSSSDFLEGRSPAAWLAEGRDPARVLALARDARARLRA
jgi:hypothetical protein